MGLGKTTAALGMGGWLLSSTPNAVMTALTNPTSMVPLAFRDMFDSSGRIAQEYQRDRNGGREAAIEESTTALVWAGGIPLGKKVLDQLGPKLFPKTLPLPNLDLSLFDKTVAGQPNAQYLTRQTVERFALPAAFSAEAKHLFTDLTEPLGKRAGQLLQSNRAFQLTKVAGVGFLASTLLGFGLPKLNQRLTRSIVGQKQDANQQPSYQGFPQTMPANAVPLPARAFQTTPNFNASMSPSSPAFMGNPASVDENTTLTDTTSFGAMPAFAPAQPIAESPKHLGQKAALATSAVAALAGGTAKLGGLGGLMNYLLGTLQKNDQLTTLAFCDLPLATGRVSTARNKYEGLEKAFKELVLIGVLFKGQSWIQNAIEGSLQSIGFSTLKSLHNCYGKNGQAFVADYKHLTQALGTETLHSHVQDNTDFIDAVRNYFHADNADHRLTKQGSNLLYDVAEAAGHIPTMMVYQDEKPVKHFNLARKIDVEGIQAVALHLDKMAQTIALNPEQLGNHLKQIAVKKGGAFLGSAAICWGIVSYLLPKTQHLITKALTGKDTFPGVLPKSMFVSNEPNKGNPVLPKQTASINLPNGLEWPLSFNPVVQSANPFAVAYKPASAVNGFHGISSFTNRGAYKQFPYSQFSQYSTTAWPYPALSLQPVQAQATEAMAHAKSV